ncbi:MAG: site-specific DNA-methyltransferase [Gammaproteobacteria bacterium]|nr:MAG: site-specific DNA-methyltransferase [Gammaproteobacteria bacterium]
MLKNNEYINKIINQDSLEFLKNIQENSVDIVLTDPPYFLDKMDNKWNVDRVHNDKNLHTIKSLPAGMKFDKNQGKRFYKWYLKISEELYRVLKPGGFFFSFSSPRLYHRMACAIEDAGFDIRDCFMWLYTMNQPKGMSLNHFIKKLDMSDFEKNRLIKTLSGWKTPQVKSCFEPIAMAQKPVDKTFLNNMMRHNVSLVNTSIKHGKDQNMHPANVVSSQNISPIIDRAFLTGKPNKKEKGAGNTHKTVKPLSICKYLISLTTKTGAVVLDPFLGSGTTAVACKMMDRNYIGIELNKEYIKIAQYRLDKIKDNKNRLEMIV